LLVSEQANPQAGAGKMRVLLTGAAGFITEA
jgi:hypothetical protein